MKARILHRGFRPRNIAKLAMGLFAVLGFGMLIVGGVLLTSSWDLLASGARAEGRVIDLEYRRSDDGGSYYPVVRFRSAGGEEITLRSRVGTSPPAFSEGEAVTVLYDPRDPYAGKIDSFSQLWFGPLMLGLMGSIFGGIGGGYWGWRYLRGRRDAWLDRRGERITARILDAGPDRSLSANGQSPWRIRAQWQDPLGEAVYVFNSRALWFDPAPFLKDDEIGVLIDRRNPRRYKFDLSALPQQED